VFLTVSLIEMVLRPGFSIMNHAISMLSLGGLGWIQITNFLVAGLLFVLCAIGLREALKGDRAGTWGPILICIVGLGFVAAGVFPPDPSQGFPPGTAEPSARSYHAIVHGVAFMSLFSSLIAACFVFASRFASVGSRVWRAYSVLIGVTTPLLIALGMGNVVATGIAFYGVSVIALTWVSATALHVMKGDTI
jgi:hypothetical protein